MGAGFHGGFGGTQGAKEPASSKVDEKGFSYKSTASLRKHIESAESTKSGREGIKGAHHKNNLIKEANRIGAKITKTDPNSQMESVEKISYKMPMKDAKGNLTGNYKSKTFNKTVYDPAKISTDKYIKQGLQAANNAAKKSSSGKLGREWTGTDNKGVNWHGYCDKNGNITSFYPED